MNTQITKKEVYKTSIVTKDSLYEMTYNTDNNTTSYVSINKTGDIQIVSEYPTDKTLTKPILPDNPLLEKGVILFPSEAIEYGTERELIENVRSYIHKYVDVSETFENIATYYVLLSWMYDKFNEVPYLRALGDFGSGKSRFLQTIGSICYKPIFAGGATTSSPIFRMLDRVQGTLILDEADFRFSDMSSDIVKILNSGYQKGFPLLRSEGKGVFEEKPYSVYGPKVIATREHYKDHALESRFLVENMGMTCVRSDIPKTLTDQFHEESLELRNKLLMWRLRNYFKPIIYSTEHIHNIHPRLNQIILPLLSIINDITVKEELKTFIIKYNQEMVSHRNDTWESDIIRAVVKISTTSAFDTITIGDITRQFNHEQDFESKQVSSRKIGEIIKKKLHLKSHRESKGICISLTENKDKIEFWKKRLGVHDIHEYTNVHESNQIE